MNSTSDYLNPKQNTGEFANGIRFALVILTLVILVKLASCLCTRVRQPTQFSSAAAMAEDGDCLIAIALGLDDTTLGSFPKLLYSQAKAAGGGSSSSVSLSCCSICLSDYKDTDMLRMLPGCGHYFHLKCIDVWLRLNPSCPSCRNWPVPIPVGKLLAEVAPLPASRL